MLKAGLCHRNYTYGDLLRIQVCSEPTELHCSTGLGKMQSPLFSSALQNRLTAGLFKRPALCDGWVIAQLYNTEVCRGDRKDTRFVAISMHSSTKPFLMSVAKDGSGLKV